MHRLGRDTLVAFLAWVWFSQGDWLGLLGCGNAAWVMIERAGFVLFGSLLFGSVDGVFLLKLRTETLRML